MKQTLLAALHTALRPVRAMTIAYRHVFAGTKVETPMNWKDI
jgi:hypothetical protein